MHRTVLTIALLFGASFAEARPLDVPFVRQEKNGCGAASVAMVMSYWGAKLDSHQVYQQLYQRERNGILLADMKRYLQDQGFRAFTLRGKGEDLDQHLALGRPVIVGLRKGAKSPLHFAVVVDTSADAVWLNDPTRSKSVRLTQAQFRQQWTEGGSWLLLATPMISRQDDAMERRCW